MFTGIIESAATVVYLEKDQTNLHITLESTLAQELKIDQSLAHNGVCLTVVAVDGNAYTVTAIEETLQKTNLGSLDTGTVVNLERAMIMNARLDGHIVQGHVDQLGTCTHVGNKNGSWSFTFEYDSSLGNVTIEKGSICVNGVSLTVVNATAHGFSVAVIPYTYEHTGFKRLKVGDKVNLEFDVIGKYVARLLGR
jgi:riboflavin synthase